MTTLSPAKPKKGSKNRPPLPVTPNPLVKAIEKEPVVKYQIIEREGQEIVVGRVKVPTPGGGHAFILRRFDTGAVSLTTMFRAAYPEASDEDEKTDTAWIKASFDTSGANGAFKAGSNRQHLRLAGTWLPTDVALAIAESYNIGLVVRPLVIADPDLDQNFRKSGLSKSNGTDDGKSDGIGLPTSPKVATKAISPPATKRRKASPALPTSPPPASLNTTTRKLRSSKSPVPQPVKPPSKSGSRKGTRSSARALTPPISSDVEEEPYIGSVDVDTDIAESKKLVEEMKAAYDTSQKPRSAKGRATGVLKRVVEETQEIIPTTFEPKEPEIGEREIVPVPRRSLMTNLPPQRQAVAWGALAFALGLGATYLLPSLSG